VCLSVGHESSVVELVLYGIVAGSGQSSGVTIIIFLSPVLNSQGMKKLRYAIQKVQKITLE